MDISHEIEKFHVILVISNPILYRSRYNLYKQALAHLQERGFKHIHTVEVVNGSREFTVTEQGNPYHLQMRTEDELWIKESMIRRCLMDISENFPEWKYASWIDADIHFWNSDIVIDTLQALQRHHVVQMWQTADDMGPNGERIGASESFVSKYWRNAPATTGYMDWHPGYAWAATRYALDHVPIESRAIAGSGDRHYAASLIGKVEDTYNGEVHENYKHMCGVLQARALKYIKKDIGFVRGHIIHYFHGRKADRGYKDRWEILVGNAYDPYTDVYDDCQGMLRLCDDRVELRDDLKRYFESRNEDANTLK